MALAAGRLAPRGTGCAAASSEVGRCRKGVVAATQNHWWLPYFSRTAHSQGGEGCNCSWRRRTVYGGKRARFRHEQAQGWHEQAQGSQRAAAQKACKGPRSGSLTGKVG